MRCRGAILELIMAGSKSYIPIFAKAPFKIFIEILSPLLLVGMGFLLKFY